jgi:hypothetical protein
MVRETLWELDGRTKVLLFHELRAQLQHNMWVTNARMAALSIITGGGKWVEISLRFGP